MVRKLDETDRAILQAFQQDARLSNKELAARVHLSPSTCHERVKRLQDEAILGPSRTQVDPTALGIGLQAMIGVRLSEHTSEHLESFQDYVLQFEEVTALFHVTGATDYILRVAVRDADHLRRLVLKLSGRSDLERSETFVVLHEIKRALPDLLGNEPD